MTTLGIKRKIPKAFKIKKKSHICFKWQRIILIPNSHQQHRTLADNKTSLEGKWLLSLEFYTQPQTQKVWGNKTILSDRKPEKFLHFISQMKTIPGISQEEKE